MKDGCPNTQGITIFGVNDNRKTAVLFNPSCKSWNCPHCSQEKAEQWAWVGMTGAYQLLERGEMVFCTVTSRPHASVNQSLYFFKQNWPKLRKRIRQKNGGAFEYMLIPEQHKTGKLHAHFVANVYIRQKWLKDNAMACGFGYMAKVDSVEYAQGVAAYMTKYMAKSIAFTDWPKNFRRVRKSQGWPTPEPGQKEQGWNWTSRQAVLDDELVALVGAGYTVNDRRKTDI